MLNGVVRVLIAEDEQRLAEAIARGLRREGMAVDLAPDGTDALVKARVVRYDVLVLDRDLPGLHGDDVCRAVRGERPETGILMLTAAAALEDLVEGLSLGADDYLPKPFSYLVLLAHLRSLTRRTLGARPAVLTAAGLALDPASRTVTRGGVPLELTTREVAVLEYLLRAAGRVVSKPELLEHCWDVNYDGDPAVVQVLVHRLRRKIEAPDAGGGPVIETVRGQGYIIKEGP